MRKRRMDYNDKYKEYVEFELKYNNKRCLMKI